MVLLTGCPCNVGGISGLHGLPLNIQLCRFDCFTERPFHFQETCDIMLQVLQEDVR